METKDELTPLYAEFGPRIYSYLRRLTQDAALAEELTQDTFLRALEHLQTFRGDGSVSNWLYRIATNLFRDYLRAHKGKGQPSWENGEDAEGTEDMLARIPDPAPPLPQVLEQQAVTQCVRDCIASLPAPYRAALLLYAVEGKTVEESVAILGCSKEAIKVRLHRARQLFKALASERCEISAERGGEVSCVLKGPGKEV
ncbi:MAG TPA: RNA polymerase sigma factor [Methylomirabilota bacterium]|jgi:RNA polymerase sigma-70 factor (ECF subfamily)|nr:RNA polymerase sigma factor [Methylomirabilota bacterium]